MCERLKRVTPLIFLPPSGTGGEVQGGAVPPPQDFEPNLISRVE